MEPKGQGYRLEVVPWMNEEEFHQVYSWLYSDELTDNQAALNKISVWNTRCHPALPSAIEATDMLVRAFVQDCLYETEKTFCQEEEIKMMYGMALIRFINLTLEQHQNAPNKIRMAYLAEKLSIPSWLLDLRNEATHSHYPSRSVLRMGSDFAMNYLKETFWSQQAREVKQIINYPSGRKEEILNLINQYKAVQLQRVENPKLRRSMSTDLKRVIKKLGPFFLLHSEELLDVLVTPGNFINADEIKKLFPNTCPFTRVKRMAVPEKLQIFWYPLLRRIHFKELMPTFLEKLLFAQENCINTSCQKAAIAWSVEILTRFYKNRYLAGKQKNGLLLNVPCLLYACIKGCTPFSMSVLETLLDKCNNKEKLNYLIAFMVLYQRKFSSSSERKKSSDDDLIFCQEDVEREMAKLKEKEKNVRDDNPWCYPPESMDFSKIPLGAVLNPIAAGVKKKEEPEENSVKERLQIGPSVDDDSIFVNKDDEEEIKQLMRETEPIDKAPAPEDFDMVCRRRRKQ